ncbi:methyltransferase domain-containing protein [Ramlibacter sp. AW1]|uniref:Methyltransferase domain-containing protein n=1 Tax=Ramlibacter aurantiacus TaxID=2801330 RepID=A0A936ZLI0_9BURK|nr:methyltransferase domain-containing protein [Ramlibacter aurantiacus]MBL0423087.1 methyltransferase domain-containing protein [Ramlibacter aurantiacus]
MNPNQALWEKGDFTRIAQTMRDSGEALVRQAGITPGMQVLDLGCGDGTTAIPAARLGARVTGVDIARNLVAAGNQRAAQAGVADHCTFIEGDACDLSFIENQSFDLVISIFGAMFAPRPFDVAREMVRVTRHGGRIVMGNWIPNDPTLVAQILRISSAYAPPPPEGFISPMTWGSTPQVIERFGAAGVASEAIAWTREPFIFDFKGSPEAFVDLFRSFYGPTMNAFEAAARDGREQALRSELVTLFEAQNQSQYPHTTLVAANFLKVTVDVG